MVIPVPTLIERGQINVGDKKIIDHLDAYTSPRLVEYYDGSPCHLALLEQQVQATALYLRARLGDRARGSARRHGASSIYGGRVRHRDSFRPSGPRSGDLAQGEWVPCAERRVGSLGSYIKQKMHFFVAKVNLKEQSRLGFNYLRPIQVAYE